MKEWVGNGGTELLRSRLVYIYFAESCTHRTFIWDDRNHTNHCLCIHNFHSLFTSEASKAELFSYICHSAAWKMKEFYVACGELIWFIWKCKCHVVILLVTLAVSSRTRNVIVWHLYVCAIGIPWLNQGQHATRPAYVSTQQYGEPIYFVLGMYQISIPALASSKFGCFCKSGQVRLRPNLRSYLLYSLSHRVLATNSWKAMNYELWMWYTSWDVKSFQ